VGFATGARLNASHSNFVGGNSSEMGAWRSQRHYRAGKPNDASQFAAKPQAKTKRPGQPAETFPVFAGQAKTI